MFRRPLPGINTLSMFPDNSSGTFVTVAVAVAGTVTRVVESV
jgi:hypothetical protein